MLKKKVLWWAAGTVVASLAVIGLGFIGGDAAGRKSVERVQLLWPNFMALPAEDRAALAQIGLQCGLSRVELERTAIINCLRTGAAELDQRDAPDFKWSAKLNVLLQQAQRNS